MPLRMARQPENKVQGTHLQTTGGIRSAPAQGSTGNASRFKTQFAVAARAVTPQWSVVADASPFGMGALLYSSELVPQAYWASELGSGDLERFCAQKGEPSFRSEWSCWLFSFRSSCLWLGECVLLPDFVCVLTARLLGCSVPEKVTRCAHGVRLPQRLLWRWKV